MIQADSGTEDIAELFRIIGHPSRLTLLLALVAGEHGVGALEQATGIGQPSLSQQLGVLRKAELVVTRREAKQVFYSLNPEVLHVVRATIVKLCGAADERHPVVSASATSGPVGAAMFARVTPRP